MSSHKSQSWVLMSPLSVTFAGYIPRAPQATWNVKAIPFWICTNKACWHTFQFRTHISSHSATRNEYWDWACQRQACVCCTRLGGGLSKFNAAEEGKLDVALNCQAVKKTLSLSTRVCGVKMCERTRRLWGHPTILSHTHVTVRIKGKTHSEFNQDKKRKVPDFTEMLSSESEFHLQNIYIYTCSIVSISVKWRTNVQSQESVMSPHESSWVHYLWLSLGACLARYKRLGIWRPFHFEYASTRRVNTHSNSGHTFQVTLQLGTSIETEDSNDRHVCVVGV